MKPNTPFAFAVLPAALALTALSVPAAAADAPLDESGFYIGLDGRLDQLSWKDTTFSQKMVSTDDGEKTESKSDGTSLSFPPGPMGAGLKFGYRFSRYLAVEVGYTISADEEREIDNDLNAFRYRVTLREAQIDALAYWPLGSSGRFKPFLSFGLAYTQINARLRVDVDGSDADGDEITTQTYTPFLMTDEFNYRVGTGVEIRITDSTYARLYARYQPYSFNNNIDGSATLGFTITTKVF